MEEYSKESIRQKYENEIQKVYQSMLEEENEKLEKLNEQWNSLLEEMLRAIAKYDMATRGGKSRDMNTLMVDIITKIEKFRNCDQDSERIKKVEEIQSNIVALNRLINN